jgi:hypothetical protein
MEIIGYGILLAIGFYIAPMIIGITVGAVALVIGGIANMFGRN